MTTAIDTLTPEDLRKIREARGWTQAQMAEALGFAEISGQVQVSRMETGERGISRRTARLVRALDASR